VSDPLETLDNDLGLSVDMLDVDRLRDWARLLLTHGADIGHWGSVPHVAGKMQIMATGLEKAIRDIGTLRAQLAATHAAIRALPRYEFNYDWDGGWMKPDDAVTGEDAYVRWDDLARLLGDPAQQKTHEELDSRVDSQ